MDMLRVIAESFGKVFVMLSGVKSPYLAGVSLLTIALFYVVMDYLIDFLLSVFGNKKGGDD